MTNPIGGFNAVDPGNSLSYLNQDSSFQVLRIIANRVPTQLDKKYRIGTVWIYEASNAAYMLTSIVNSLASWTLLGSPAGDLHTLTGNSGGAVVPTANNINVVGSGDLTFAGSGSTLTGSIVPGSQVISTINTNVGGPVVPSGGAIFLGGGTGIQSTGVMASCTLNVIGGGFRTLSKSISFVAEINTAYTMDGSAITGTLPALADFSYGDAIMFTGTNVGLYTIAGPVGQTIKWNNQTSSNGGTWSSTSRYQTVMVKCVNKDIATGTAIWVVCYSSDVMGFT